MLVFYDYDRTLVVHSYPEWFESSSDYMNDIMSILDKDKCEEVYGKDEPLKCMQWHVEKQKEQGNKLFVITHEIFNLRAPMKQQNIKKWYGDGLFYLEVDSSEHKIDMILGMAKAYGKAAADCLLIDDKLATLQLAAAKGIKTLHVSNIMAEFEKTLEKELKKPISEEIAKESIVEEVIEEPIEKLTEEFLDEQTVEALEESTDVLSEEPLEESTDMLSEEFLDEPENTLSKDMLSEELIDKSEGILEEEFLTDSKDMSLDELLKDPEDTLSLLDEPKNSLSEEDFFIE